MFLVKPNVSRYGMACKGKPKILGSTLPPQVPSGCLCLPKWCPLQHMLKRVVHLFVVWYSREWDLVYLWDLTICILPMMGRLIHVSPCMPLGSGGALGWVNVPWSRFRAQVW